MAHVSAHIVRGHVCREYKGGNLCFGNTQDNLSCCVRRGHKSGTRAHHRICIYVLVCVSTT